MKLYTCDSIIHYVKKALQLNYIESKSIGTFPSNYMVTPELINELLDYKATGFDGGIVNKYIKNLTKHSLLKSFSMKN